MLAELNLKDLLETVELNTRQEGSRSQLPLYSELEQARLEDLFADFDWVADLKSSRNSNAHYEDWEWDFED